MVDQWLKQLMKILERLGIVRAEKPLTFTMTKRFSWTGYEKHMSKYFTDEETKGLVPDLCFKLDRTREFFGAPIVMTCGYRSPEHNAKIGGVPGSAHTKGMAVDVRAPQDPAMREKLMWAAGCAGFRRVETAPKHFHFDVDDKEKPSPCFWQGDDK